MEVAHLSSQATRLAMLVSGLGVLVTPLKKGKQDMASSSVYKSQGW